MCSVLFSHDLCWVNIGTGQTTLMRIYTEILHPPQSLVKIFSSFHTPHTWYPSGIQTPTPKLSLLFLGKLVGYYWRWRFYCVSLVKVSMSIRVRLLKRSRKFSSVFVTWSFAFCSPIITKIQRMAQEFPPMAY